MINKYISCKKCPYYDHIKGCWDICDIKYCECEWNKEKQIDEKESYDALENHPYYPTMDEKENYETIEEGEKEEKDVTGYRRHR